MRRNPDIALEALISHYACERPISWEKYFEHNRPLEVEIGSGLGEFLIKKSRQNPGCNFVGIEQQWKSNTRFVFL